MSKQLKSKKAGYILAAIIIIAIVIIILRPSRQQVLRIGDRSWNVSANSAVVSLEDDRLKVEAGGVVMDLIPADVGYYLEIEGEVQEIGRGKQAYLVDDGEQMFITDSLIDSCIYNWNGDSRTFRKSNDRCASSAFSGVGLRLVCSGGNAAECIELYQDLTIKGSPIPPNSKKTAVFLRDPDFGFEADAAVRVRVSPDITGYSIAVDLKEKTEEMLVFKVSAESAENWLKAELDREGSEIVRPAQELIAGGNSYWAGRSKSSNQDRDLYALDLGEGQVLIINTPATPDSVLARIKGSLISSLITSLPR